MAHQFGITFTGTGGDLTTLQAIFEDTTQRLLEAGVGDLGGGISASETDDFGNQDSKLSVNVYDVLEAEAGDHERRARTNAPA